MHLKATEGMYTGAKVFCDGSPLQFVTEASEEERFATCYHADLSGTTFTVNGTIRIESDNGSRHPEGTMVVTEISLKLARFAAGLDTLTNEYVPVIPITHPVPIVGIENPALVGLDAFPTEQLQLPPGTESACAGALGQHWVERNLNEAQLVALEQARKHQQESDEFRRRQMSLDTTEQEKAFDRIAPILQPGFSFGSESDENTSPFPRYKSLALARERLRQTGFAENALAEDTRVGRLQALIKKCDEYWQIHSSAWNMSKGEFASNTLQVISLLEKPIGQTLILDGWSLFGAARFVAELANLYGEPLKNLPEFEPGVIDFPPGLPEESRKSAYTQKLMRRPENYEVETWSSPILPCGTGLNPRFRFTPDAPFWAVLDRLAEAFKPFPTPAWEVLPGGVISFRPDLLESYKLGTATKPAVFADEVYSCSTCGGDLHAKWTCPNCKTENLLTFFDDEHPPVFVEDACKNPECGLMVTLNRPDLLERL